MATFDENIEKLKKLTSILDGVREATDTEASPYLRKAAEKIDDLKDDIQQAIDELTQTQSTSASSDFAGTITIFISLFQADAENLPQWQRTVRRVAEYSLTRPIYRKVDHIQELIRSRPDPRKEAYAIVTVDESDIIQAYAGKQEQDAFGHELVTLREGALTSENVQQFIHGDLVYDFIDSELVIVS